MRWVFCFAMVLGMASPALAADYDLPILRGTAVPPPPLTVGPATFTRWSGFYDGGDVSYYDATADFARATQPLLAFSLRNLTLEDQVHPSGIEVLGRGAALAPGYGGFLGYNTQWQDLCCRRLPIAFVSKFRPDCRGCVHALCTRTCTQNG